MTRSWRRARALHRLHPMVRSRMQTHSALLLTLLVAAPAHAQSMVEVPTPPEVRQRIEDAQPKPLPTPTVAAPLATDPVPPPIVAPSPALPHTHWRVRRRLELSYIGVGVFGTAFLVTLLPGVMLHQWRLDVPLVGPALEIPRVGGGVGPAPAAMLFLDCAVQAGGLAMVAVGAALRRKERIYDR